MAGDYCVIIHSGGFGTASITAPSIWIRNLDGGASNWGGSIFTRRLTAADITAGTVTVTPTGSFNAVIAGVSFQGDAAVRAPIYANFPGSGASSSNAATDYSPATTDVVLAYASNRAASNNTSTFGTALQTVNAANGSGALYAASPAAVGGVTTTFAYSTAGSGRFEFLMPMRGPF